MKRRPEGRLLCRIPTNVFFVVVSAIKNLARILAIWIAGVNGFVTGDRVLPSNLSHLLLDVLFRITARGVEVLYPPVWVLEKIHHGYSEHFPSEQIRLCLCHFRLQSSYCVLSISYTKLLSLAHQESPRPRKSVE